MLYAKVLAWSNLLKTYDIVLCDLWFLMSWPLSQFSKKSWRSAFATFLFFDRILNLKVSRANSLTLFAIKLEYGTYMWKQQKEMTMSYFLVPSDHYTTTATRTNTLVSSQLFPHSHTQRKNNTQSVCSLYSSECSRRNQTSEGLLTRRGTFCLLKRLGEYQTKWLRLCSKAAGERRRSAQPSL